MPFEKELEELKRRKEKALKMGGPEKIKRQHEQKKLTARERIDRLLDPGTLKNYIPCRRKIGSPKLP
jgi:acetyl-CoA carboxylase carboxyltransferase component